MQAVGISPQRREHSKSRELIQSPCAHHPFYSNQFPSKSHPSSPHICQRPFPPVSPPDLASMAPRKPREPQVLESFYPVVALVFILVACVELCDAATVVDVYRLIHYDISGVPFGSRAATLNHHASSLHFPSAADLSRSVLIIPLSELNITFLQGTILTFLAAGSSSLICGDFSKPLVNCIQLAAP